MSTIALRKNNCLVTQWHRCLAAEPTFRLALQRFGPSRACLLVAALSDIKLPRSKQSNSIAAISLALNRDSRHHPGLDLGRYRRKAAGYRSQRLRVLRSCLHIDASTTRFVSLEDIGLQTLRESGTGRSLQQTIARSRVGVPDSGLPSFNWPSFKRDAEVRESTTKGRAGRDPPLPM